MGPKPPNVAQRGPREPGDPAPSPGIALSETIWNFRLVLECVPEGEAGASAARLGGRGAGMHGVRGCLGRRFSPGTWIFPRSLPPRAPLAP